MSMENYPADWDKRRKKVLNRDDYECQKCGGDLSKATIEAHVHHIVPLSEGGSNGYGNLEALCRECHVNQHSHGVPKEPVEVYKCEYCDQPFIRSEAIEGTFCSKLCASKFRAERIVRDINHNGKYCSSCHRQFGSGDVCNHCGNWKRNKDCLDSDVDRVALVAYAYRVIVFGETM